MKWRCCWVSSHGEEFSCCGYRPFLLSSVGKNQWLYFLESNYLASSFLYLNLWSYKKHYNSNVKVLYNFKSCLRFEKTLMRKLKSTTPFVETCMLHDFSRGLIWLCLLCTCLCFSLLCMYIYVQGFQKRRKITFMIRYFFVLKNVISENGKTS